MQLRILAGCVACVVVSVLPGCGRAGAPAIAKPTPTQLAEFIKKAQIDLPLGAETIGYREERGMEDALWLQVRISTSDLQSFLDSSPFRGVRLTTNDQYIVQTFREFFAIPPIRHRCGQKELPNARFLNMVIDDTSSTNAVIYLMWHET